MSGEIDNEWPGGWDAVPEDDGPAFVAQLLSETGPIDGMREGTIACIGRFGGSDDMVYSVDGWQAPFFVAHLGWSQPDRRWWVWRVLRTWPRLAPGLVPVGAIGELARYFD